MPTTDCTYLMMLATASGLAYVVREQKMAFPPKRQIGLDVGDRLLLYTTRGAFNNPTRDRGRVVGTAEVTSPITPLPETRLIAGRPYSSECSLKLKGLAPFGDGVVLADIINQLEVFKPDPPTWSSRMRRSVLRLPAKDSEFILTQLEPVLRDPNETIAGYLAHQPRKRVG